MFTAQHGVSGLGFGPFRVFIRFNGRNPRFRARDSRAESAADKSCKSIRLCLYPYSTSPSMPPSIDLLSMSLEHSCYSLVKL